MTARLRRVATVSLLVTSVDVAVLATLALVLGWHPAPADAVSIAVAATLSFTVHAGLATADDPHARWVRRPGWVALIVVAAGVVDVATLALVAGALGDGADPGVAALLVAKAVALATAGVIRLAGYRGLLFGLVHQELDAPAHRPPPPGEVAVSVVIPAYRAAGEIGATVAAVRRELADLAEGSGLEIVVVDDGSPDATADEARAAGADQVLVQELNRGKGAAVRAGMIAARGRWRVFTDADLSYSPDQIRLLVAELQRGWDVVVGSRHHEDATALVRAGRLRELAGRVFNAFTAVVLLGRYRDTQCGLKGFRSDVARLLFSRARVDGFAFDVEILHLVERYRLSLAEVPVTLEMREASTVRVGADAARMVRDLFRIRQAAAAGAYDLEGEVPLPG